MKKYIYELFYRKEGKILVGGHRVGFFSSLPEIRTYITEDGSPRENYRAYRHKLNPGNEEQAQAVLVEINWEK